MPEHTVIPRWTIVAPCQPLGSAGMHTQIIRSEERDTWPGAAILSRQSFPATGNFDLAAGAFGLLMMHNDDTVAPGEGFDMHAHHDVEILTWVLEGRLHHRDNGSTEITELGPGQAQHISAGSGVRHAEINAAGYTSREKLRVVQSWLPTDAPGGTPFHAVHDFTESLADAALAPVASGTPGLAPLTIRTTGATLWAGRFGVDARFTVPQGEYVHLYVARGAVRMTGTELAEGDVLRQWGERAAADGELRAVVEEDAEVLVWVMEREPQSAGGDHHT